MRIELTKRFCTLYRETGDKALSSERAVTFAIMQQLKAQGYSVKRVRGPQGLTSCPSASILRMPKMKTWKNAAGETIPLYGHSESMLWHERYAIELSYQAFNAGSVTLNRVWA
jgi:hypothetical protein